MKKGRKSKFDIAEDSKEKWNVALYIRLSLKDGDKAESNSVVNQKELLNMFIEKDKELNFYDYYVDDGYSGGNFERPAFQKMMQDINSGLINTVIVKDLSRLGRNYIGIGKCIETVFLQKNIRFISVCDNIDSFTNPKSLEDINFPLKNLINENYCRDISKKITTAFSTMKKEGKFIGSNAPFGYIKDKEDKHHLLIDDASAKVVKIIFDLCESGLGNTAIAKELNKRNILTPSEYNYKILKIKVNDKRYSKEWTSSIVAKILDNRVYCGDLVQNKSKNISYKVKKRIPNKKEDYIIVENTHEPIIERERFLDIQKLRKDRKFNWNKRIEDISIFEGMVICSNCENPMNIEVISKKEINDIELTKYALKCDKCNKENTKDFYVDADILKTCIFKSIKYHMNLLDNISDAINAIKPNTKYIDDIKYDVGDMKSKLDSLNKEKEENYKKWKRNEITDVEYNKHIKENFINEERLTNSIDDKKSNLLKAKQNMKNIQDNEWVRKLLKYKEQKKLTKEMLNELVEKIYIYKSGRKIKIKFKYGDAYQMAMNYLKMIRNGGNINA